MNICDCPHPPGGRVRCPDDQLAICGYQDGKIVSGCYDRPGYVSLLIDISKKLYDQEIPRLDRLVMCNWIISTITDSRRADADPVEDSHLAMLSRGQYENKRTGEVLRFSLPRIIQVESRLAKELTVEFTNHEWPPDALDEDAMTEWIKSVAEVSRRIQQVKGLAKLNHALAELKRWYEHVLSASQPEVSQTMTEAVRELARLRDVEANRKMARPKRWIGAGKKWIYLFGLRRARKDVTALWLELLPGSSV